MLVGDTITRGRRTGIHRVVIEAARGLAGHSGFDLVRWDYLEGRLRYLDAAEMDCMFGAGDWPIDIRLRAESRRVGRPFREQLADPAGTWLLIPEVGWHLEHGVETLARAIAHCHDWGGRAAFIFYDLIPITNPAYAAGADLHEAYLRELSRGDLIIPISATSGRQLTAHWQGRGVLSPPPISPVLLPDCGFGVPEPPGDLERPINRRIVLAGTIEPRKRQVEFIRAMAAVRQRSPEVATWEVTIVGSVHGGVAAEFQNLMRRNAWLTHIDYADDAQLARLVREAGFTAFVSDDEGYGLPIAESLALGAPCLCADFGAMAEIAAGGGCLTVDVRDQAALEAAIVSLCEGPGAIRGLRAQIAQRLFRSWADYGRDLAALMAVAPRPALHPRPPAVGPSAAQTPLLDEAAFADLASAEVISFPDAAARDAFIIEAATRRWPALLPSRLIVGDGVQPAMSLAMDQRERAVTERRELLYQQVSANAEDRFATRRVFLRVLISTFNRKDFCVLNAKWILNNVLKAADVPVELVIADGGSTDGTLDQLRLISDSRLTIVESPVNVGMLGGLREAARLPGAEYVWLVGDDDFIQPKAFAAVIKGLREHRGVSFAFTNFAVYARAALGSIDRVSNLVIESIPVAESAAPSGLMKVREAASQTDNLFTAIYAIVWRADLLSAAYEHAFDGAPFSNLIEAIPCTEFILRRYSGCDAYWHNDFGVVGNAHNSWSRHRPRWHGAVMPMALALARDAGVDPILLQGWADNHRRLLLDALQIAAEKDLSLGLTADDEPLALSVFRAGLPLITAS